MQTTIYGGLSGKARTIRSRNRATRLHAQQLLDDYLEPEPVDPRKDRFIPIRSRSEFLPAVATWRRDDEKDSIQGDQLELSLAGKALDHWAAKHTTSVAFVGVDAGEKSLIQPPAIGDAHDVKTVVRAAPAKTPTHRISDEKNLRAWAKPKTSFQPISRRRVVSSTFEPSRFLYGCLLGSAAAAIVLLTVSVVFG